jgi:hypothetical protein
MSLFNPNCQIYIYKYIFAYNIGEKVIIFSPPLIRL